MKVASLIVIFNFSHHRCGLHLNVTPTTHQCEITFDEIPNPAVLELIIGGELDVIPDLSDAVAKFENLYQVEVCFVKLKIVQRVRLTPFKEIEILNLSFNQITELEPDTFNDLKKLEKLFLSNNNLTELHPDLFKELNNLERLELTKNQLKTLPADILSNNKQIFYIELSVNNFRELQPDPFEGLHNLQYLFVNDNQLEELHPDILRNKPKLDYIQLRNNKIRKIYEFDLVNMPNLEVVDLLGNVCIDTIYCKPCYISQAKSLIEINDEIRRNCTN